MTNPIDSTFAALADRGEKALIAYIMAGDPSIQKTVAYAKALAEGGADIIELGMPFSDPIADGPVIQRAAQRALGSGTNIRRIFEAVRTFRKASAVPVILMGYVNPVIKYGAGNFFRDAASSGVSGVILPDVPLEESGLLRDHADIADIHVIMLAAPTSGRRRLLQLARNTQGFLYYISLTGVTGSSKEINSAVFGDIAWVRERTRVPVAVGFGISTPEQAGRAAVVADGIVLGSAFVKLVEDHPDASNSLHTLAHAIKSAIRRG